MSYLVLARKARPQTFDQVVGQRSVVRTLLNSIQRDRIAHAILFSGVRGVGKTTLARIMAKAINCLSEDLSERPCGSCSMCREIAAGNSLDLYEIDGASNRGIQEIRELKEKIRFLPTMARAKIIIIDEVHMLTTEAFNALLKTLEEPPAHVHFMFATTEKHKIPITILSRCQQYELKRVPAKDLYDHFNKLAAQEGFSLEPQALSLIVREAGGSVRDGLSLLDQMFSFGEKQITVTDVVEVLGLVNRQVLLQLASALLAGKRNKVFQALEEIFTHGMDVRRFMEDLLSVFRNLTLSKIEGCAPLIDLPQEDLQDLHTIAADYQLETLHQQLAMLMRCAEDLRFTGQPRLVLETSFLKIIEAGSVVPLASLVGKIDEILEELPPPLCELKPEPVASAPTVAADQLPSPELTSPTKAEPQEKPAVPSSPPINNQRPDKSEPPQDKQMGTHPAAPQLSELSPPPPSPPPEYVEETEEYEDAEESEEPNDIAPVKQNPHVKDVRRDWLEFIEYVKERKVWMAQDLQRADNIKSEGQELRLTYGDPANCSLLRQKEQRTQLTEYVLDFFQKPLKVVFVVPTIDENGDSNGADSLYKKRQQLANDPLVQMAADVFNGQVGDVRIGPKWR